MIRRPVPAILAALAAVPLLLSAPTQAADPAAVEQPRPAPPPLPLPVWAGTPPETVSAAVAALHDACAGWPKQVPSGSEAGRSPLDASVARNARACEFALDPENYANGAILEGSMVGAIAAGLAVIAFQLAKLVLFMLGRVGRRGLDALWDRRPPRLRGWSR